MNLKGLMDTINKLTSKKNAYNIVVVFLLGVLLVMLSNFFKTPSSAVTTSTQETTSNESVSTANVLTSYEEQTKKELKAMLSKMKGVGRVDLMINFECGEEYIPAYNTNGGKSTTIEKDNEGGERKIEQDNNGQEVVVSTDGGKTTPFILKKINPKVEGVIIVAEGAENEKIKKDIIAAISSFFGIPNYKIQVFAMN
ncbi:stage III sporulation protein AG [Clostridium thermarum]|uniref:stage III sporulation protein AG n=1 Tax=Clostridium thermarum TaxID=1716543 RepID=UPI001122CB0F|nr:stage III sporulation protein AG [Clostridium thermarum]